MALSRRRFLKTGGVLATAFLTPAWPRGAAGAITDPVLVALYLRGGADGLNLVVPFGDPTYYQIRPDIQVAPDEEIPLDGFYGLNPLLADLMPLFTDGDLAILHAAGSPDGSRSHFDSMDFMERAAPGNPTVGDGWLNRMLAAAGAPAPWSGVSFGTGQALALQGEHPSLTMQSLARFSLAGTPERRAALESLYRGARPQELERAASGGFASLDVIAGVPPGTPNLFLPSNPYYDALRDTSALIRADVGVRVVTIDLGGWDHHENETAVMEAVARQLGNGLAAFRADLGEHWDRTAVVVMTEFGRTAAQNGSLGTDHGHGTVMMAAGGGIAGGRVITRDGWPGLSPANLFEGRDLAVTTDFRDVFAELLHVHMGTPLADLPGILPGHDVQTASFPGLF